MSIPDLSLPRYDTFERLRSLPLLTFPLPVVSSSPMESPLTGRNVFRFESNCRRKFKHEGISVCVIACGYLVGPTKYDLERLGSFLNREMEEAWSEMACGYREITSC